MKTKKIIALAFSASLALGVLTGCGGVKVEDEITEVKGWPATDGTNLYCTRLDYDELKTSNSDLQAGIDAYVESVKDYFYDQEDNLEYAQMDYDEWSVEIDGKEFPSLDIEAFENEEATEGYYDVLRITTTSKKAPYISFRTDRLTNSSKSNVYSEVTGTTLDAETGKKLAITDIYTDDELKELDKKIAEILEKDHKDDLKENYLDKISTYRDEFLAIWYVEKGDLVIVYKQGTLTSLMAGDVEIRIPVKK